MSDICEHGINFYKKRCYICRPEKFAAPTGLAAQLNRERLTKIENRLGWGGSDKWPVSQSIGLWAVAAETVLDERDALKARLEMIAKICKSTKHLDQIADILKECEAANEKEK